MNLTLPMKALLIHLMILTFYGIATAEESVHPVTEERIKRLEDMALTLAAEIKALRADAAAQPKSANVVLADQEMQPGALAKIYVRTGGANASTPPSEKVPPNDVRISKATEFNGTLQAQAAGYEYPTAVVSVIFEGYLIVERPTQLEFLHKPNYSGAFRHNSGFAIISNAALSSTGETSVRLDLDKGKHLIHIQTWNCTPNGGSNSGPFILYTKESGKDPRLLTPADLWTPKTEPTTKPAP